MSSLPNSSYLSVNSSNTGSSTGPSTGSSTGTERYHRHRRSAAISGDFDAMGLGLFSTSNLHKNTKSVATTKSVSENTADNDLDKYFHFNNSEDFANNTDSYSFPADKNFTPSESSYTATPPKYSHSSFTHSPSRRFPNLNSPARIRRKPSGNVKTGSSSSQPVPRFFLTEETVMGEDNVPDAIIDLDEVLYATLHISNHDYSNHFLAAEEEFLGSPFAKPQSSPYLYSPSMSLPNSNSLFNETIHEDVSDEEEACRLKELKLKTGDSAQTPKVSQEPNIPKVYIKTSANASASSLKNKSIRPSSNDVGGAETPVSQSVEFLSYQQPPKLPSSYQQLTKPESPSQLNWKKQLDNSRLLAHSHSLPALRSNRTVKFQRPGDSRLKFTELTKLGSPSNGALHSHRLNMSPDKRTVAANLPRFATKDNKFDAASPSSFKQISNSPISTISDTNSTIMSTSGTFQSTDRSSLISHDHAHHHAHANQQPQGGAHSILVSNLAIATNKETEVDLETIRHSPPASTKSTVSSSKSLLAKSPRRSPTPNEIKTLKDTRIPLFKRKSNKSKQSNSKGDSKKHGKRHSSPSEGSSRSNHRKSKSFSILLRDPSPKPLKNSGDDDASVTLNRSARFINWFRKR